MARSARRELRTALAPVHGTVAATSSPARGAPPSADALERDRHIADYLTRAQSSPPPSWTTAGLAHRDLAPAYFQYPAMMSPAVQRDLLRVIMETGASCKTVLDPFAGSGTVLSEAMYAGLDCSVADLNPLAILICRLKSGHYHTDKLRLRRRQLLRWIGEDQSRAVETNLKAHRKWFRPRASRELSRIRRAIRRLQDIEARRFFGACLAETVRLTSNSRTSTYKLHKRTPENIKKTRLPRAVFEAISLENIEKHEQVAVHLASLGKLHDGRYSGQLQVALRDATSDVSQTYDLLMTSPPYGDNQTTVPYGQSAYLPLHWIDLKDIDDAANATLLVTTHELDRRSLGGQRPNGKEVRDLRPLRQRSPALDAYLKRISHAPKDRRRRVLGFVRDLSKVLPKLISAVRVDGYMAWTVGNRRVGGVEVPLADILSDFLCERSAILVGRCTRTLPSKRMALRNATSATMRHEHLLIFRRVAAKSVT